MEKAFPRKIQNDTLEARIAARILSALSDLPERDQDQILSMLEQDARQYRSLITRAV
jgi:hypothetical protein